MTPKEFYEWAEYNNCEEQEIYVVDRYGNHKNVEEYNVLILADESILIDIE